MSDSILYMQPRLSLQQWRISQAPDDERGGALSPSPFDLRHTKDERPTIAEALTGRIRSDAGMLRQASLNAGEGVDIARKANAATSSILSSLEKMRDLASARVNTGQNAPGALSDYAALTASVKNTVDNTAYNDIPLMSKDKWTGDQRLTPSVDGKSASLPIQLGASSKSLDLKDFSGILDGVDNASTVLGLGAEEAQEAADKLSDAIRTVRLQNTRYAAMAAGFASDAKDLKRQSRLLDKSAARAAESAPIEPAAKWLYGMLGLHGSIIDDSW